MSLSSPFSWINDPLSIGSVQVSNRLFVAPMAGVTDRPFRSLCRRLGAGYAVGEMVTALVALRHTPKTARRSDHTGEIAPIAVQIAGTEPEVMAEAARYNIGLGAQVIDINMGCPAKKVCNRWAGSALMQNEALATQIVAAVVQAAQPHGVPVTLKMRTGWRADQRNAVSLARRAQDVGVALITVHGRTREQGYKGQAQYDTLAEVKAAVQVPVVANGDITHAAKARAVLAQTGVDALMIGRAAQSRPWLFQEIAHELRTGEPLPPPRSDWVRTHLLDHLQDHYAWYPGLTGVRTARKHIGWMIQGLPGADRFRPVMNALEDEHSQWRAVADFLAQVAQDHPQWPVSAVPPASATEENAS